MKIGGSQMLERLYDRPLGEYITRLIRAKADVDKGLCTLRESVDLYKVSIVDLRQLRLEEKEWNKYVQNHGDRSPHRRYQDVD